MAAVDALPYSLSAEALSNACNKTLARNEQQNTNSDGFELGLKVRLMTRLRSIDETDPAARLAQITARTICFGILKLSDLEIERVFTKAEVRLLKAGG
ncbi:MAG TPA: hypothetical protein VK993_05495 [Chthoniobacterales bacterium]|nr:hypothetical protein [Chthoniobacterales bacterium]